MSDVSRLPGPMAPMWEWQYAGACREVESETFYHPDGERGSARQRRDAAAKAVCDTCPVILRCREHALRTREVFGVWGGLTEDERSRLLAEAEPLAG